MEHDPFDKIEGLGLSPEQVAAHQKEMRGNLVDSPRTAARRARVAKRKGEKWARMQLEWSERIAKEVLNSSEQMLVLMHLMHWATFANGEPILASAEKTGNVDPHVKLKTLKKLEAAGDAEIEWRGSGKNPLVTLKLPFETLYNPTR